MNRTIKFRAWLVDEKRMVDVGSIIDLRDENGMRIWPYKEDPGKNWLEGDRCEIMQFTGLHDKDGKEIYEGDVLGEEGDDSVKDIVRFGEIELDRDSFDVSYAYQGFYIQYPDGGTNCLNSGKNGKVLYGANTDRMMVIGNIHQDPQLLNKEL